MNSPWNVLVWVLVLIIVLVLIVKVFVPLVGA